MHLVCIARQSLISFCSGRQKMLLEFLKLIIYHINLIQIISITTTVYMLVNFQTLNNFHACEAKFGHPQN